MPPLLPTGRGGYAFENPETLKTFLSIGKNCLAITKTDSLQCKHGLTTNQAEIEKRLSQIHNAGLPSRGVASTLEELAQKCTCGTKHPSILGGYETDVKEVSQHVYIYTKWHRSLWVAFLAANDVFWVSPNGDLPHLDDVEAWNTECQRLKSLPALGPSPGIANPNQRPTYKGNDSANSAKEDPRHPDFAGPLTMRPRISTFDALKSLGLSSKLKKANPFSRSSSHAWPSMQRLKEARLMPTAAVSLTKTSDQTAPEQREPIIVDDSESQADDTPAQGNDQIATPEKRQNLNLRQSYNKRYSTSTQSFQSAPPSPTFSEDSQYFDGTPNTTYTDATEKSLSIHREEPTNWVEQVHETPTRRKHSPLPSHDQEGRHPASPGPDESSPDSSASLDARRRRFFTQRSRPAAGGSPKFGSESRSGNMSFDDIHQPDKSTMAGKGSLEAVSGTTSDDEQSFISYPDLNFMLYNKEDGKQYKALRSLLDILEKPIHRGEGREPGYIYMFTRDGASGLMKIGRSKGSLDGRMKKISGECVYQARLLGGEHMDAAASLMESCIHYHLGKYRHIDIRCTRLYETKLRERKLQETPEKTKLCQTAHDEWFRVSETEAKGVIGLWKRFIQTTPLDNGRLNSFWRNKMVVICDHLKMWENGGRPAFEHWDREMKGALDEWETSGRCSPVAELQLGVRVRSEGDGSILEVFDTSRSNEVPVLAVSMLSRKGVV